jgi:hypothetical protein
VHELRELAERNTPVGVMSVKLGRTEEAIRSKAQSERISLAPPNGLTATLMHLVQQPGDGVMDRDAKQSHDAPMPGLTVQREAPTVASQSRLIGTLEIDTSTNCLVVRTPMGTAAGTDSLVDIDVAWPPGWSVALLDGSPALIDATGQLAGRPGDEVDVGGGFWDTAVIGVVSCTGQERIFEAYTLTRV